LTQVEHNLAGFFKIMNSNTLTSSNINLYDALL
jgi:hypothetical protein